MAEHGHSEACCTIPPAVSKGYTDKGRYLNINGITVYHTGESSAKYAVLHIFDIFGLGAQVKQGADILAHAKSDHHIQVFMPDWFDGKPATPGIYPPDTPEKKKELSAFLSGPAKLSTTLDKIPGVLKTINEKVPGIEKWAILGHCWGGKIVSLSSREGTPFSVAAEAHPAMVDPEDAKHIKIPLCMLASKDEDVDDVKAFQQNLTVDNHVETFADQFHGWMAARADLEDDRIRSEYERGYQTVLDFFVKHL